MIWTLEHGKWARPQKKVPVKLNLLCTLIFVWWKFNVLRMDSLSIYVPISLYAPTITITAMHIWKYFSRTEIEMSKNIFTQLTRLNKDHSSHSSTLLTARWEIACMCAKMLLTLHYHRQKWNVEYKRRDVLTNNDWKELNYPFDGSCVCVFVRCKSMFMNTFHCR